MERVHAKSIHRIRGQYSIHVFSRQQSGTHDNKYVKVYLRKTSMGKYLMETNTWEENVKLTLSVKIEIEDWVQTHKAYILKAIEEMG